MICFSDNDIVLKLAHCDFYDDFFAVLNISPSDVYLLPAFQHSYKKRIRSAKNVIKLGGRILDFIQKTSVINEDPDIADIQALADVPGVDDGEVILLSIAARKRDCLIATGDKRCLCTMHEKLRHTQPYILNSRKMICFEQVLLRILGKIGFSQFREKTWAARDCDTALRLLLGHDGSAPEASVRDGLESNIRDLRAKSGILLID